MPAAGVVSPLDKLEDGQASLDLGGEPPPVEQFAIGAGCSSSQPSYSLPANSSEELYFSKIFIYTAFCNLIEK